MPDGFTSGELEIMRGDLAGVLYAATPHRAEYIFEDSILGIREDEIWRRSNIQSQRADGDLTW